MYNICLLCFITSSIKQGAEEGLVPIAAPVFTFFCDSLLSAQLK